MSSLIDAVWNDGGRIPLAIGVMLIFVASRAAAAEGVAGAGRRAIIYWLPIALAALLADWYGHGDLALSIVFSTSVASLSFVLGAIIVIAPVSEPPVALRRLWPFLVPAAILTLLAGITGRLTGIHALLFFGQGMGILLAWGELSAPDASQAPLPAGNPSILIAGILLALAGAVFALRGTTLVLDHLPSSAVGPISVILLGLLLVIPLLMSGAAMAHRNEPWSGVTAGVGVVLLNLCLLLPAVIVLWRRRTGQDFLIFSRVTWRVDNVMLILLGFVLFPAALGRWKLGRSEGIALIGLYAVYVLMEAVAGAKS